MRSHHIWHSRAVYHKEMPSIHYQHYRKLWHQKEHWEHENDYSKKSLTNFPRTRCVYAWNPKLKKMDEPNTIF